MNTTKKASDLTGSLKEIWENRVLLFNTVRADIRSQYAGTALGLAWVVLGPIALLTLYSVIYAVIFRVRVPKFTIEEYILNVFSGLVPFLAFAQALSVAASVMRRDKKLFFSNFPAVMIPMKATIVAYVMLVVGSFLVIAGDIIVSKPTWTLLFVPVIAVLQLMFSVGLGMVIALLTLVLRDIEILIQYIVIALLVVTPITYTPDMIPGGLKSLLYLNPLFYFVSANQHVILLNTLPPMEIILVGTGLSLGMFLAGLWLFKKAQQVVNDLI